MFLGASIGNTAGQLLASALRLSQYWRGFLAGSLGMAGAMVAGQLMDQ